MQPPGWRFFSSCPFPESIIFLFRPNIFREWKTERRIVEKGETQKQPSRRDLLKNGLLKIYSKFTGEHLCRNAISIKLLGNFVEITLRHGCSPVNLLHILRTRLPKNSSWELLLERDWQWVKTKRTGVREIKYWGLENFRNFI